MSDTVQDRQTSIIGSNVERVEDEELLTGRADYLDDIDVPKALDAAILRSRYAHARIENIDSSDAEALDGVVAVYTMADMEAADTPTPNRIPNYCPPEISIPNEVRRSVLASNRVRYQGEPIAIVVGEDPYTVQDALDKISVDYETIESVPEPEDALAEDAAALYNDVPDNVAYDWEQGDAEAVDEISNNADHVVTVEVDEQRIIPTSLEPRGAIADYDRTNEELSLMMSTQTPHPDREYLSEVLEHPEHKIHVEVPRIGGGFGAKIHHYPAEAAIAWCARELERPVKWQDSRTESSQSDAHGRALTVEGKLAFDDDGTVRGLGASAVADIGAHASTMTLSITTHYFAGLLSQQYEIPEIYCRVRGVLTSATPVDAFRGVNEVTAATLVERLMDAAAAELDIDPAEFRRQNQIPADAFPYETATGLPYDSGNFEETLDRALEVADYEELRRRQERLREEGRYLGIGIASFTQVTGLGPGNLCEMTGFDGHWESARITMHKSGTVSVYCGTQDYGQGHETSFAQIVAAELGIPFEDIDIVEGDTEQISEGLGTHASRSAVVGGSAISETASKIIDQAREIAAHQLEADVDDIEFEDGTFSLAGAPERSLTIQEVAKEAHLGWDVPDEPGLEAVSYYDPEMLAITSGTHIAVVEVNPDTGDVEFEDYVAVNDVGNQINPTIVDGQIHGGVAHGIGQALYEGAIYDESGNLSTSSLQDYTVPKAEQLPHMETDSIVTPCPHNPLGVKGAGETGPIAAVPTVVNAVADALEPFGFDGTEIDTPLTPEKIWEIVYDETEGS